MDEIGIRVVILGVGEARRSVSAIQGDFSRLEGSIRSLSGLGATLGTTLTRTGAAISGLGRSMTLMLTTPLLALDAGLLKTGIDFEDSFQGIIKTVDGTAVGFRDLVKANSDYALAALRMQMATPPGHFLSYEDAITQVITGMSEAERQAIFTSEEFGKLTDQGKDIREQFRELALEIPLSVNELAQVGELAGALGIPADQIVEFTKAMGFMGVSTDLSAAQATDAIAHLANIMGVDAAEMANFAWQAGSAITGLGNTSAATESEISALALRIAGAGRAVGLTTPEILGISTTLAEMGIKAESGGTAVSRVLMNMMFAVSEGGNQLETFAGIAGMTSSDFARMFKSDAAGAMEYFTEQLAKAQEEGRLTSDMLLEMGLSGVRVRDVLNRLGPNMGNMRENIELANRAWTEHVALQEEAAKRFETVKSMIQIVKNGFVDLGITIFDLMRNDLIKLIDGLRNLLTGLKQVSPSILKMAFKFSLLVAAIGPVLIIFGTMIQSIGTLLTASSALMTVLPRMTVAFLSMLPAILPLIGILGALYLAWTNNFMGIQTVVKDLGSVLSKYKVDFFITKIWDALSRGDWQMALALAHRGITNLTASFGELVRTVRDWLLIDQVGKFLGLDLQEMTIATQNLMALGVTIGDFVEYVGDAAAESAAKTLDHIGNAIEHLGKALGGVLTGQGETVTANLVGFFNDVGRALLQFPVDTLDTIIKLLGNEKGIGAIQPESIELVAGALVAMVAPSIISGISALAVSLAALVRSNFSLIMLGAALYIIQSNAGGARDSLRDVGTELKQGDIPGAISKINLGFLAFGATIALMVLPYLSGLAAALSAILPIIGFLILVVQLFAVQFLFIAGAIKGFMDNSFGIQDRFHGLAVAVGELWDAVSKGDLKGVLGGIASVLWNLALALVVFPMSALAGIKEILINFVDWFFPGSIDDNLAPYKGIFDGLGILISDFLINIVDWLSPLGDTLFNALLSPFRFVRDLIALALTGDYDSVKTKINDLKTNLGSFFDGVDQTLQDNLVQPFINAVISIAAKLTGTDPESLKSKLSALPGEIKSALSGLLTSLQEALQSPFETVIGAIDGFIQGIIDKLGSLLNPGGLLETAKKWADKIPGVNFENDALGGHLGAGQPAIVGERGPELFVPHYAGMVVPNDITTKLLSALGSSTGLDRVIKQMNSIQSGVSNQYNSTYAPQFNAAPSAEMLVANGNMYQDWLMSGAGI